MHRIKNRTLQTPWGAQFIRVASKAGRALTVEYFRENQERIPMVNPIAGVITEETLKMMIGEGEEKMPKAPKEPKGKAEADPRRKDQKKRMDLDRGRELTDAEKEVGAGDAPEVIDFQDTDKLDPKVKSRAKLPVGKVKGKSAFKESADGMATYRWKGIEKALYAAKLSSEQVQEILMHLQKSKISESNISEAPEDPRQAQRQDPRAEAPTPEGADDYIPGEQDFNQSDVNALDNVEEDEPEEISVGMSTDEVIKAVSNVPARQLEKVQNLGSGVIINIIKMADSKVTKVIPGKVLKTFEKDGKTFAKVEAAGQKTSFAIASNDAIFLRQGEETGVYYYLDKGIDEKSQPTAPNVNYVGEV